MNKIHLKRLVLQQLNRVKEGRRAGLKAGGLAFTATVGVITVIAATGSVVHLWSIIIAALFTVGTGLWRAHYEGRASLISPLFVNEMSSEGQYSCSISTAERLREACEMSRLSYRHFYVQPDVVEQWRMKNHKAFVQIVNSEGELCASFGILVLKDSFMDQFIDGKVSDSQLKENDICNFSESTKSKRIYISGVVVRDHLKHLGRKRAWVMTWTMLMYFRKMYGVKSGRSLYAIAITKESEILMKNLKFELICPASNRKDGCNMYRYHLTKKSWEELRGLVGDCHSLCRLAF